MSKWGDQTKIIYSLLKYFCNIAIVIILVWGIVHGSELWNYIAILTGVFGLFVWALESAYDLSKNREFYKKLISFIFSIILSLIITFDEKIYYSNLFFKFFIEISVTSYILFVLMFIIDTYLLNWAHKNNLTETNKVFEIRKNDINRLDNMLSNKAIYNIGVEAKWGQGKTIFLENMELIYQDKYEFLFLNVLDSNLNDLKQRLMEKLDTYLCKNGVLVNFSGTLQKKTPSKFSEIIGLIFPKFTNYSDSFSTYKGILYEYLKEIKKPLVIVVDDIDRISDVTPLRELFYITESLGCEFVKFVFLYDHKNLEQLGLSHNFLNKYISHKMRLTILTYTELIGEYRYEISLNNVWDKYNCYIRGNLKDNNRVWPYSNDEIGQAFLNYWQENIITSRKMKQFLLELQVIEKRYKDLLKDEIFVTVAFAFGYIKVFFPDLYEQLDENIPVEQQFLKIDVLKALVIENNNLSIEGNLSIIERFIAYGLLGLDSYVNLHNEPDKVHKKNLDAMHFSRYTKRRNDSEMILLRMNAYFRSLLISGYPLSDKYSDLGNQLRNILNHPQRCWTELWNSHYKNMWQGINRSQMTQYMGESCWLSCFYSLYVASQLWSKEDQIKTYLKILLLWQDEERHMKWNTELLKDMAVYLIGISANSLRAPFLSYIRLSKKFVIQGHFNNSQHKISMQMYLQELIRVLQVLEYIESWKLVELLTDSINKEEFRFRNFIEEFLIKDVKRHKNEWFELKDNYSKNVSKEFDLVLEHLQLLVKICYQETPCIVYEKSPNLKFSSKLSHPKSDEEVLMMSDYDVEKYIREYNIPRYETLRVLKKRSQKNSLM